MSDRGSAGDKMVYLLIGAGIGATLALLFAPKPGRELRGDIATAARRGYRKGSEAAHDLGEKISDGVGSIREGLERQKGQLASALEAGKQAYKDERQRSGS